MTANKYNPEIWGPHYWFVLHSIAATYPDNPNKITKRKYYDFIMNLPLFLPHDEIGNKFGNLIDKYPVSPYLDCRESFQLWMHFIHNKINAVLGKEEILLTTALEKYQAAYKPRPIYLHEQYHIKLHYIHVAIILLCVFFIYSYYK